MVSAIAVVNMYFDGGYGHRGNFCNESIEATTFCINYAIY